MSRLFEQWGRKGGRKRARRLSAMERSAIASKAAKVRWGQNKPAVKPISSVRINKPEMDDPVYVEELVSEGSLEDWRRMYRQIADQPFGPTAAALEKVLSSTQIYGVGPLWQGILRTLQGA